MGFDLTNISPSRVWAECYRKVRPPITFDPGNPVSVENAKKAARKHDLVILTRHCDQCTFPCVLRILDDSETDLLFSIFGIGI